MYRYDEFDAQIVKDRAAQFRGQVERRRVRARALDPREGRVGEAVVPLVNVAL